MLVIRSRKDLCDSVRKVASGLPPQQVQERLDLITAANMIEHTGHGAPVAQATEFDSAWVEYAGIIP